MNRASFPQFNMFREKRTWFHYLKARPPSIIHKSDLTRVESVTFRAGH